MLSNSKIEEIVQRSKDEIIEDILEGTVPSSVRSFSELHDYTDANTYGGLCDEDNEVPFEPLDDINAIQNAVNDWLESGEMLNDLEDRVLENRDDGR